MQISDEVIKVLEYLCDKIGITIDWTSNNILPYLEQLCGKFVKWEIGTSIGWIVLAVISTIIALIFSKVVDWDGFESFIFWCILIIAIVIIGCQAFDIIECYTFPEKAIYDYIQTYLQNSR